MPITGGGAGSQLPRGIRETYADFLADGAVLTGTSILRRPDAISFDYLTAHTVGPIALGITSAGIVSWVWRARATATEVWIARENVTRDGWDAETLLFTYGGAAISEMDFCFDQNGSPVVVADRADVLWIYYNDLTLGGYDFRSFGPGRCPRAVLDDPLDVNGSDVLVFYVDTSLGIVYRQQRDRYAVVYPTTPTGAAPVFVPAVTPPNYGPVSWRVYSFSSGFVQKALAEVGALTVEVPGANLRGAAGSTSTAFENGPSSRVGIVADPHGVLHDPELAITFTQLVYGFSADLADYSVLNYMPGRAGTFRVFRLGLHVATVQVDPPTPATPVTGTSPGGPGDPKGHVKFSFVDGFDELRLNIWTWDNAVVVENLNLLLTPAQLLSVSERVMIHGPAAFALTGDPTIASAVVDGITIEMRAPLDVFRGTFIPAPGGPDIVWDTLYEHSTTPGPYRPMTRPPAGPFDPPVYADGVMFQHGPPTAISLNTGSVDPYRVYRADVVLSFSADVSGVELWPQFYGSQTEAYAYDAGGALLAMAFGTTNQPLHLWADGIRTVKLWGPERADAYGGIANAWAALMFKLPSDLPASVPGGVIPTPPQVFPPAPPTPISDVFLEDAVRTPDGRVSIVYSVRDAASGQYSFGRIDTVLYPYHAPLDGEFMTQAILPLSGLLFQLIVDAVAYYDGEGTTLTFGMAPGGVAVLQDLSIPITDHAQPYVDEAMTQMVAVPSGVLFLVIHDWLQYYNLEGMRQVVGTRLGFLTQVVFDHAEPYASEGMTQGLGVKSTGNSLIAAP